GATSPGVHRQAWPRAGTGRSALPGHPPPRTPGGHDGRGHEGGGLGPGLHLRLREDRPARHGAEPTPDPGERPGRVGRRRRRVRGEAPAARRKWIIIQSGKRQRNLALTFHHSPQRSDSTGGENHHLLVTAFTFSKSLSEYCPT